MSSNSRLLSSNCHTVGPQGDVEKGANVSTAMNGIQNEDAKNI